MRNLVMAAVLVAGCNGNLLPPPQASNLPPETAQSRYEDRTKSCYLFTRGLAQQGCLDRAQGQYAIESQRETIDQQNALQARGQLDARCERIISALVTCGVVEPARAFEYRPWCTDALKGIVPAQYGVALCVESATSCDAVARCGQGR